MTSTSHPKPPIPPPPPPPPPPAQKVIILICPQSIVANSQVYLQNRYQFQTAVSPGHRDSELARMR